MDTGLIRTTLSSCLLSLDSHSSEIQGSSCCFVLRCLWCKLFHFDFTLGLLELDCAGLGFDLMLVHITGMGVGVS